LREKEHIMTQEKILYLSQQEVLQEIDKMQAHWE